MRNSCLRFQSLLALAGSALLLMGADDPVKSTITGSNAGSMTNNASRGAISRTTGSAAGGTTNTPISSMSSSASISAISRVTATPVVLSPYEEELAKSVKFERQVILAVKEETRDHIGRLVGYDEDGYRIIASGIVVSVPEDQTDHIVASLRKKLRPLKYMPFVVEMNEGLKIEKIGILKGTDQYEILRVMHTDGDDYDISNQDVIDQLKEWEVHSPFDIIGADSDWVEIEFKILPKDLIAFAEEVYYFCPDAVDQGPGSIAELVKEIKKTKKLFLWWD